MKYINTLTGNIIDANSKISGEYWKEYKPGYKKMDVVEEVKEIEPEKIEDEEVDVIIEPDVEEEPKPVSKRKGKK